jgi:hypothetical protein
MKTDYQFFRPASLWLSLLAASFVLLSNRVNASGNWLKLANTAPDSVDFVILLSDGTVMAANNPQDVFGNFGKAWYRLTPDPYGHYVNGEWSQIASMTYVRHAFAAQILPDGRFFIAGGEHPVGGAGEASAEIYDPLADGWTLVNPPVNLMDGTQNQGFRDCESKLLPDGTVLLAPVAPSSANGTLIYDPRANSWSAGQPSIVWQAEQSWVTLPDGSILTVDHDSLTSERYIPALNQWLADANLPVNLWASLAPKLVGEMGPGFLLPNGKAFFLGGSGHTAIYTPSGTTNNGYWVAGPDIPNGLVSADAPAAMMPNGNILCAVAGLPTADGSGNANFPSPTSFCEYDYSAGTVGAFTPVDGPTGATDDIRSQDANMLVLPDGSVLYCHSKQADLFYSSYGSQLYVYAPDGTQVTSGKPHINAITANGDGSFHLVGTGLNGISEGAAFGDESQMNSNFPLVAFLDNNNGHVDYGRTYNWSSTGVQTGNQIVSTEFTVSLGLLPQTYSLTVSGAGLSSDPVSFIAPLWVDFNYQGSSETGSYSNPYKTLTGGANAALDGGTIFIKGGHHAEAPNLTKPMFITSVGGTAVIGR